MSAPHPTAIDTADPAPLRIFRDNGKTYEVLSKRHCRAITETESEVMRSEQSGAPTGASGQTRAHDTRPPAMGADRKPLEEIATLIRSLTYGEMMELSEGINTPAGTLHKWSKER